MPCSDPPHHEFPWGSRAHSESSKLGVFEVLAKVNDIVPRSLPALYEEALRNEQERAGGRVAGRAGDCPGQGMARGLEPQLLSHQVRSEAGSSLCG